MKKWIMLITLCMCAALLYGCEPTSRYKVLSFFFDGVPNPVVEKVTTVQKAEDKGAAVRKTKTSYKHGPYDARLCEGCHMRGNSALVAPIQELCFRCHEFRMDKKWVHGPFASGDCRACHDPHESRYKFFLVSEQGKLCFNCHEEKAVTESETHKGSDMQCVSCHDPHMSDNQYMLK